jgi:hypothetical protein
MVFRILTIRNEVSETFLVLCLNLERMCSKSQRYYLNCGARVTQAVQCLATNWTTGRSRFDSRQWRKGFSSILLSRPALRPTQPPVQWLPVVLSRAKPRPWRDPDHSPHLVLRSRMSKSYTSSPSKRLHGV